METRPERSHHWSFPDCGDTHPPPQSRQFDGKAQSFCLVPEDLSASTKKQKLHGNPARASGISPKVLLGLSPFSCESCAIASEFDTMSNYVSENTDCKEPRLSDTACPQQGLCSGAAVAQFPALMHLPLWHMPKADRNRP